MRIDIKATAGSDVLSGAEKGKSLFAALISATAAEPEGPEPLFLNFAEIEVATASFLRESVVALKQYKRATGSKHYPVLANINQEVADEVAVLMDARNDVFPACELSGSSLVSGIRIIGSLDPKQERTFNLVEKMATADAAKLMEQYGKEEKTTSTTAWNNRLAGLVQRGLIREYTRGRAKFYKPLFERTG